MKRCPKCNADYFDNMLEFCLEDGTRLAFAPQSATATIPTMRPTAGSPAQHAPLTERVSEETVVISDAAARQKTETRTETSEENVSVSRTTSAVETVPVVLALAHNWWQWLYLEKTYVYSLTDYLLSANFLMWLLLLVAGAAVGIYTVRNSKNKTFAIIGLVTLGINLILFLVPRK